MQRVWVSGVRWHSAIVKKFAIWDFKIQIATIVIALLTIPILALGQSYKAPWMAIISIAAAGFVALVSLLKREWFISVVWFLTACSYILMHVTRQPL